MKKISVILFSGLALAFALPEAVAQNVLANQVGYLPDHVKYVYFTSTADSFSVIDRTDGSVQFKGPIVMTAAKDPATGLQTSRGDFSAFTREGTYHISTSSGDTSVTFRVANDVYEDLYRKSMKGFYFQRCGTALLAANAGVYARTICHTNDAVFHSSAGTVGSAVTTGGWHDAGDYGKYVVNAGISVGTLLLAYEMFPAKFRYDDLNIPESGNGVPDLLDEVRFELQWLLEMQEPGDGGVYFKVTTANFDAFEMPSKDLATRYIYERSSTATGDFAAVMAQAARIYRPYDSAFAATCLDAARLAWYFLQMYPTIVPYNNGAGFLNPQGTSTGEYGDANDSDERLWAAAELFETTGEASFNTYFKNHYADRGIFTSTMGWPNVGPMAQIAYLIGSQPASSSTIVSQLQTGLNTYCASLVNRAAADGLNVSLATGDYGWGSNSGALNNAVLLIVGSTTAGNQGFLNAALEQLNYILGCNGLNRTFVTGVGTVSPMNPHHRPSYSDGVIPPIPGLLAGGPDRYLDDAVLKAAFTSATPPALCYLDNWQSYASNEIAINWNAPLVFVAGFFNQSPATSVNTLRQEVPHRFSLNQNYPNPFNPKTVISSQLTVDSRVKLAVYDLLGREVAVLANGRYPAGTYSFTFDGNGLASGVYFYRLIAGENAVTRKMVLQK